MPGRPPLPQPSQAEGLRGRLEDHWRQAANAINRAIAANNQTEVRAAIRAAKVAEHYVHQHAYNHAGGRRRRCD
jgi:hypothetical protein